MQLRIRLLRLGYRTAYLGLRVWWFLARPPAVGVKCLLFDGDRVLLVRHTYGPSRWEVPGGSIKRGEAPLQAARREVAEELGLDIDGWRELGVVSGPNAHRYETLHCYAAEVHSPQLTLARGEIAEARWFPRAELPPKVRRYARELAIK